MKLWLLKIGWKISIFSRWYKYWSKFYRWLYQKDLVLKQHDIRSFKRTSIEEVMEVINSIEYKADGPKELWDVCARPMWLECVYRQKDLGLPIEKGPMDCDEFAVWAANVYDNGLPRDRNFNRLLSVAYLKDGKKVGGHMVCVIYYPETNTFAHVGNWGYRDGFESLLDVINDILKEFNSTLIGWCLWDQHTLSPLKYSTKLPNKSYKGLSHFRYD